MEKGKRVMPTYEYECPDHGVIEVLLTSYNPGPEMTCGQPTEKSFCRKRAKKILSVPGGVIVEGGTNARRSTR